MNLIMILGCLITLEHYAHAADGVLFKIKDSKGRLIAVHKTEMNSTELSNNTTKKKLIGTNGVISQSGMVSGHINAYYISVDDSHESVRLTNRSIRLVESPTAPTNVIVDVMHEDEATVFLYRDFVGYPLPFSQPALRAEIISQNTNSFVSVWTPSTAVFSKVESARITGSVSRGNLAIETTAIYDESRYSITNHFRDGKWQNFSDLFHFAIKNSEMAPKN
jgi:hypothetical protein